MFRLKAHSPGENFKKTVGSQFASLNSQARIYRGIKNAALVQGAVSVQGNYRTSRIPLKRVLSRPDLSNKHQIKRALKSCHDLAIGEVKKELVRREEHKRLIEGLKVTLTPQELGEILRVQSKETAERNMYRMKNLMAGDIIAEIELEAKRKKDLNKRYPFIESVEYEMKNLQQNRDDRSYLFPSVDKKVLRLTPGHLDERTAKVQENYTEVTSSIHKCLSDMQTQGVNVDELTKDKSISKEDRRKFCSALKSGSQELVFQYLDARPELINQQFSVSPLINAIVKGVAFVHCVQVGA